jgi:hypothetical protein
MAIRFVPPKNHTDKVDRVVPQGPAKDAVLRLRLPRDLHQKFSEKCEAEGDSMSNIVRRLMKEWL